MALQIVKPSSLKFCKSLIFAPSGAGKTVFLGTAQADPRTSPMLVLDFEGGSESLDGLDIDIAPIRDWDTFNEAYELLTENEHGYKSVGIDSISEVHKWALLEILRKEGGSRDNPDLVQQGDYGTATTQMRKLLRAFRDLPMHVFYVGHAKDTDIPKEGRVRVPDLAGQLAEEVVGLMSVSGYLALTEDEEGEDMRLLLLNGYPKFRIKARSPWGQQAVSEIEHPDITKLLDALRYPMVDNGDNRQKPKRTRERKRPDKPEEPDVSSDT